MNSLSLSPNSIMVASDYHALCEYVADQIADLVRRKPNAVLGLATGSTPLGVYDILARRHQNEGLDFSQVTCFNLDEYYPMERSSTNSYYQFMQENLFQWINCYRWSVPDGRPRTQEEIALHCRRFEAKIRVAGGLDLQLLGIGRTGHIGFNEPGSPIDSRTRQVTLDMETREDAAKDFGSLENVPTQAVSMGIGTIFEARQIVLMASGLGKASIIQAALEGEITEKLPASLLRHHPNVHYCLDTDSALFLKMSREM